MLYGASYFVPGIKVTGTGRIHPGDKETQMGHVVPFQDICVSSSVAASQVSAFATGPLPAPSNPTTFPQHQTMFFFLGILFKIQERS